MSKQPKEKFLQVALSHFKLLKIKKSKKTDGMNVSFAIKTRDGNWRMFNDVELPEVPAPALTDELRSLNTYLFNSNGMRDIERVLRAKDELSTKEFEAAKVISPIINRFLQTQLDGCEVTGIVLQEHDEDVSKRKVLITGKRETAYMTMAFNSPLINLENQVYGFEDKIAESVEVIIDEAFQYVIEGKKSQLEMFVNEEDKQLDLATEAEKAALSEASEEKKQKKEKKASGEKPVKKTAPVPAKKKKETKLSKQTAKKKK